MNHRLLSILASLGLLVGALAVTAAPVSAASFGACGDSGIAHYNKGNFKPGSEAANIKRVRAHIAIGPSSQFKPCSPDDNQGSNGPSVLIEMFNDYPPYGAWVQAGIVRCENIQPYCTGAPRIITEWHEALTNFSTVYDIGPANYNQTYEIEIALGATDQIGVVRVDGVTKKIWNVGSQLNPGDDPDLYWFTELHDRGDGLGSNSSGNSVDVGQMQYDIGNVTWYRTSSCNYASGANESVCVKNGANALYFYTVN